MPSASFTHAVSLDAAPETIWTALMDAATWENIGPVDRVWDPTHDVDGVLTGYRWSTEVANRPFEGTATALEHSAPSRYIIDLDAGEMAGMITIDIAGSNPHSEMRVELEFRTKGLLSAMFFPLIKDAIFKGLPEQIDEFAAGLN